MGRLFDPVHQNVFFTLLIGLLAMMLCDYFRMQAQPVAQVLVLILAMVLAWALHTDYGYAVLRSLRGIRSFAHAQIYRLS